MADNFLTSDTIIFIAFLSGRLCSLLSGIEGFRIRLYPFIKIGGLFPTLIKAKLY